ncbi:MAG: hypothetical protein KatS3mg109_1615 [Pirellulaceae bacterium]|nr:MAG: hypothetical protein KatS3mg109_1615 [Pirellulaceae bacterium]
MPWWGDGWDTVRPVGGTVCRGDPAGRPYDGQPYAMGDAPRRSDAHRDGRMGTAYRTPTIVGDPSGRPYTMGDARDGRRAPARGGGVMGGTRYGLWGVRHTVPQPLWATRRVAPTRWATRPDGRRGAMGDAHRYAVVGVGARPVGGAAYRTPTIVGDAPGHPDAMGDAVRWATRTGMPWWGGWVGHGTAWGGTAYRTPPIVGNPSGRPYDGRRTRWATHAMGDAPRRSDAHRHTVVGVGARPVGGTAYRTPTIVGDPPGRPDLMGDAPRRPDAHRHAVVW